MRVNEVLALSVMVRTVNRFIFFYLSCIVIKGLTKGIVLVTLRINDFVGNVEGQGIPSVDDTAKRFIFVNCASLQKDN